MKQADDALKLSPSERLEQLLVFKPENLENRADEIPEPQNESKYYLVARQAYFYLLLFQLAT